MTNRKEKFICAGDNLWKNGYIKSPVALFKDEKFKKMSPGAKVLYIALLSRLSLSEKNGWRDKDGNVFVYFTLSDVTEYIGCCKEKAIKLFSELDEKTGTGLIRRKRNGFGMPSIIYFNDISYYDNDTETKTEDSDYVANQTSSFGKNEHDTSEKTNSSFQHDRIGEVGKTDPNYNNINYIYDKYINNNYNQSVIPAGGEMEDEKSETKKYYESLVKNNIDYENLASKIPGTRLDEFVSIILSVLESPDKHIKIGGHMLESKDVKEKFLCLDGDHIRYVYDSFKNSTVPIHNVRSYIITALYRSLDSVSLWMDSQALF